MEKRFVKHYSKGTRKHQESNVLDFKSEYANNPKCDIAKGLTAYNFDNNLFTIKSFDYKTKQHVTVKAISTYHSIENFDIKSMPVDTYHQVKKKINGDKFWLFKVGSQYIFAGEPDKNNKDLIKKLRSDPKYKWLIDKHCKNGTCAELIYSVNDFYLNNIITPDKITDWSTVSAIGDYFEIKTSKPLNSRILSYDKTLMDYFYSDYHFDESDYIPSKDYLIMFEFRNGKYLMCKI